MDGRVAASTGGSLPWGTLAINVSGSFVVGLLFALITERAALPADLRGPLLIGFLGSYTTTLMLEEAHDHGPVELGAAQGGLSPA